MANDAAEFWSDLVEFVVRAVCLVGRVRNGPEFIRLGHHRCDSAFECGLPVLKAIYAAPFHNNRSAGPGDGMEKSHEEILRILDLFPESLHAPVLAGSKEWISDIETAVESPAADHLIATAKRHTPEEPLCVVAIGAATNVTSALLKAPEIMDRTAIFWLVGHPSYWHSTLEFNLAGDWHASRALLDSEANLFRFPCAKVAEALNTTLPEMTHLLEGRGEIAEYLLKTLRGFEHVDLTEPATSKVIWDLAPLAWLVEPGWVPSYQVPSPILSSENKWSHDQNRPLIEEAHTVKRDLIFRDLAEKLGRLQGER